MIQASLNNASNVFIELSSNELIYEFKVRDILVVLFISEKFMKSSSENFENTQKQFKILELLNETRLRNRQETIDATSFANVKIKILHDKRHKSLFLKSKKKTFLSLHKEYNLSKIINKKLFQQRCDSFIIKRRVNRLAYELNLSSR